MNTAVVQSPRPIKQNLRYLLPRWIAAFVVITLIEQLAMFPPAGRGFWYIANLVFSASSRVRLGLRLRLLATLVEPQRQPSGADSELRGCGHHCRCWQLVGDDSDL